ncbi:MAG TPA: hypothetical protein VMV86_05040 [Methanosarcinales archaeon]|nr:hypothetical protein [Methanosarcinales archaeon]
MRGGDKYQSKPRQRKAIPKESKKRKREHIYYSKGCKELEAETRELNNGKIYCFFSGDEIKGFVVWHHLLGRTGDYYTDKGLLVPCDNDTHLRYHRSTYDQLIKETWYKTFLSRLIAKSSKAYQKELNKQQKSLEIE